VHHILVFAPGEEARAVNSPAREPRSLIHHHYAYIVDKVQYVRREVNGTALADLTRAVAMR
jgi:hypothetical protein